MKFLRFCDGSAYIAEADVKGSTSIIGILSIVITCAYLARSLPIGFAPKKTECFVARRSDFRNLQTDALPQDQQLLELGQEKGITVADSDTGGRKEG